MKRPSFVLSFCLRPSAAFAAFFVLFPLAAVSFADASADGAGAVPVESRIDAATVYPDRAVVSRVAKLRVAPGTNAFVFDALPAELVDDSVQVSAQGTVGASLLDVSARTIYLSVEPDARVRAAAERVVELRRRELELGDESQLVGSQRALVATIEQSYLAPAPAATNGGAPSAPPARLSLDDYGKFMDFSEARRRRIEKEARGLAVSQAALAEEIGAAEKEFARLRGEQPARRLEKRVTVRLAAVVAGELRLNLRYAVPGADWTPAYDARLMSAERTVQLDAFGLVRNRTGEDWKDVELTLSTARPGLGGAAPEVVLWRITASGWSERSWSLFGFCQKKPKRPDPSATVIGQQGILNPNEAVMFGASAGTGLTVDGLLAASEPAEPVFALREAKFAGASTETGATSASFRIATPTTLASDNTPRRVPIGTRSFSAELNYDAAPKWQETAYLAARMKNTSELPFLGGTLNAFLDEGFVAVSRLETTMPGEEFVLDFGADEGVAVKRMVLSRFTDDRGIASKGRRTTYDILTTVTNHKRTPERVVVRDVLPISSDEKVVVKLAAPAEREFLKPEEAADEAWKAGVVRGPEGRIAWRLELKPGEKRELPMRFSIEHPAGLVVEGVD
jgi:hypothetical protein